jgi:hypothetical protein
VAEKTLRSEAESKLKPGKSYLIVSDNYEKILKVLIDAVKGGMEGLLVSRVYPDAARKKYGLEGVAILWLSTIEKEYSVDPKDLDKIVYTVKEFLRKAKESVVLLDGIEFLILHNDFRSVVKTLLSLRKIGAELGSRILLYLKPKTLSEEEMIILEREFEVLKQEKDISL